VEVKLNATINLRPLLTNETIPSLCKMISAENVLESKSAKPSKELTNQKKQAQTTSKSSSRKRPIQPIIEKKVLLEYADEDDEENSEKLPEKETKTIEAQEHSKAKSKKKAFDL
jgi:hypothetical protein